MKDNNILEWNIKPKETRARQTSSQENNNNLDIQFSPISINIDKLRNWDNNNTNKNNENISTTNPFEDKNHIAGGIVG